MTSVREAARDAARYAARSWPLLTRSQIEFLAQPVILGDSLRAVREQRNHDAAITSLSERSTA